MKKYLSLVIAIYWLNSKSQTVGYDYDLCGNRIDRVLGVSSTNRAAHNDSTMSYYEPTMKLAMEYGISIFPNPTNKYINVVTNKIPEDGKGTIILYDNTGRELQKIDHLESKEEISLENYNAGIYNIAIIFSKKDKLFYKVIKQ